MRNSGRPGPTTGMILYLGTVSGLMGGLFWFAIDTLAKGASLGERVLAELTLPLGFLFLPLAFYSLAGLVLGLVFALLQLGLLRGGRSVLWSTLPVHFPLSLLWSATLLAGGWFAWERYGWNIGSPHGPAYLAGIIALSFLPIYLVLLAGRFAWRGTGTRVAALVLAAAPLSVSSYHLRGFREDFPGSRLEGPAETAGPGGKSAMNVLLITVDTLRRDHLGCYGNPTVRTRAIDRLAAEGVLFENGVAQAPITLPSHSSILTGTYPPRHGVRDNGFYRLEDRFDSLAERLQEEGYATAAFVSAFPLESEFGLDQGFALYDDELIDRDAFYFGRVAGAYTLAPAMRAVGFYRPVAIAERKGETTVTRAIRWLDAVGARPFFIWIHLFDPHNPLDPPPAYEAMYADRDLLARVGAAERERIRSLRDFSGFRMDSPEVAYMRALYEAEVTYTDDQIGRLLDRIDALGVAGRTLVVLTADHGQSLSEHNFIGHNGALYAQTINVPLIFRLPGILPPGARVGGLVQGVDLTPTILDLLGLDPIAEVEGVSLAERMLGGRGVGRDRPAYFETLHAGQGEERLRGIIAGGWKLIRSEDGTVKRLYHEAIDPEERVDLSGTEVERLANMEALLDSVITSYGGDVAEARIPLDRGRREMLRTLGYVW